MEFQKMRCNNPSCKEDHLILIDGDSVLADIRQSPIFDGLWDACCMDGTPIGFYTSSVAAMEAVQKYFENLKQQDEPEPVESIPAGSIGEHAHHLVRAALQECRVTSRAQLEDPAMKIKVMTTFNGYLSVGVQAAFQALKRG